MSSGRWEVISEREKLSVVSSEQWEFLSRKLSAMCNEQWEEISDQAILDTRYFQVPYILSWVISRLKRLLFMVPYK